MAQLRLQRGLVHLAVLSGFALLTVIMTWPLAANVTTAIPGDSFDGWQNYWNLWWMKLALVDRGQNPLVTDMLYAPTGVTLYFHTLNPFNGLVSLPAQLAGSLIVAYNFVVLLSWTLAGYGTFLLTKWTLVRAHLGTDIEPVQDAGAFLAGVIFTFAPFHMAHLLGHMQVMSVQWIPFYALYLLRSTASLSTHTYRGGNEPIDPTSGRGAKFLPGLTSLSQGRSWWQDALWAGLFLTFVGLCDWYFVLYLVFFTGLALIWFGLGVLWPRREPAGGHTLRRLAALPGPGLVAAGVFVTLLSPMLMPMVREAARFDFMVRPASDLYVLSASVADFLIPNRLHTLFRPESFTWIGNQIAPVSERTISVGYAALLLAGLGVRRGRRYAVLWLAAALFFFGMALGPRLHWGNIGWDSIPATASPGQSWTLFGVLNELVPFMRISRSVSRYAVMVQLSVAVLAGLGATAMLAGLRQRRRWSLVAVLLLAVVLAEFWVAPYPVSPPDTPAFYRELAMRPGSGSVLNLPMNYDRPGYLLYQTVHGRPLTVAYISRDDPRTLTTRVPLLQHLRRLGPDIIVADVAAVGMTTLHDLGVEYVVLDRYKMPGGEERVVTETLASAVFGAQEPVLEDDRITVYRVVPPAEAVPYVSLGPQGWGALDGDSQGRRLTQTSASLGLHHVQDNANAMLRLRYRSLPTAALSVSGTALPSASDSQTVVIPLDQATLASGEVQLHVREPDAAWIEAIELVSGDEPMDEE